MDYNLKKRLRRLNESVTELQKSNATLMRKSRGTTRANRICAQQEIKISRLAEQIAGLAGRMDNLGVDNPEQAKAWNGELARLEKLFAEQSKRWADLEGEILQIKGRVDEHEERLDSHDLKFASHGERIEGVEVVVGSHATAIASLRDSARSHNVHPIAWVLGIIAGIVAGWAWAVHDWTQTTTLNGVKTVVENTAANSLWAAVVCGTCVGLIVLFITSLLIPSGGNESVATTAATAEAGAGARVVIDRNAPTEVHPAVNNLPPPPVANQHAGVR